MLLCSARKVMFRSPPPSAARGWLRSSRWRRKVCCRLLWLCKAVVVQATRPIQNKACGESKEKTLTRLTQTGEGFSFDLKGSEAVRRSIHKGSIPSEWLHSLSHSLSGGWVARAAKCERKLLCSTREVEFRFFPSLVEVGLRSS